MEDDRPGHAGLARWIRLRRRTADGEEPQGSVAVPLLVAAGACLLVSTGGWLISGGGHSNGGASHLQEQLPDGVDANAVAVSGSPKASDASRNASASPSVNGSASPSASAGPGASPGAGPGTAPGATGGGSGLTVGTGTGGDSSGSAGGGGGGGFPSAGSTGPRGCASLTPYTGPLNITTPGTTLNCVTVTGLLEINASNVTVSNSVVNATTWWGIRFGDSNASATGFRLLDSRVQGAPGRGPDNGEYDYGVDQAGDGYVEIGGSDISGFHSDVDLDNGYLHDNYIHGGTTGTAVDISPGAAVRLDHNTIVAEAPQGRANAAVFIENDSSQHGRSLTNNLVGGGSYALYCGGSKATSIVVTGNAFTVRLAQWSGVYGTDADFQPGNAGNTWSGNTWYDGPSAGRTVAP